MVILNYVGSVPTSDNPILSHPITFSLSSFSSCFDHLNPLHTCPICFPLVVSYRDQHVYYIIISSLPFTITYTGRVSN